MMDQRPLSILIAATLALGLGSASADPLLEDRLARVERILENQSASDILLQMQQIQQEMQELRGLVETQQFELQKLQRQQRDQFLDIDSRLGATPGATPGAAPGVQPATPSAPPTAGPIDASGLDLKPPVGSEPEPRVGAPTPASPGAVGIPSLPSPETPMGNERDNYREAFELLKQRKYPEAADSFNALLRQYPQGEFTDNTRYWLAETYFVQRNYPAALAEFDRLVRLHPASPKVPGALLKIGYIQYDQQDYQQASTALKQLIAQYPDSTEARLAQSRLERIGREVR